MSTDVHHAKDEVRQRVWERMDSCGAGRSGSVREKIPNFHGAETASRLLSTLEKWCNARVIKANPDKAQAESRRSVLDRGQLLYMAVPKLATQQPFYEIDPHKFTTGRERIVTGKEASKHAPRVSIEQMRPIDVVLCGSVAVNPQGVRIGKGAGYSDIEVALLSEAGLIGPETLLVTTVHELQVLDEELPEACHDFRVDLVVTPEQVLSCTGPRRTAGIAWEELTAEKIAAIPALRSARSR